MFCKFPVAVWFAMVAVVVGNDIQDISIIQLVVIPLTGNCSGNACVGDACTGAGCSGIGCTGKGCTGKGCTGRGCTGDYCSGNGCSGDGCTGAGCSTYGCIGAGCTVAATRRLTSQLATTSPVVVAPRLLGFSILIEHNVLTIESSPIYREPYVSVVETPNHTDVTNSSRNHTDGSSNRRNGRINLYIALIYVSVVVMVVVYGLYMTICVCPMFRKCCCPPPTRSGRAPLGLINSKIDWRRLHQKVPSIVYEQLFISNNTHTTIHTYNNIHKQPYTHTTIHTQQYTHTTTPPSPSFNTM